MNDMFPAPPGTLARYESDPAGTITVSTIELPHLRRCETAIRHPQYNDHEWIIVQMYADEEAALEGHDYWTDVLTSDDLPDDVVDLLPDRDSGVVHRTPPKPVAAEDQE